MQELPKAVGANISNNPTDITMDNPQVTSHQWAWLAGIWDGEGTFGIYKNNQGRLSARLTLSNTSMELINGVISIFDAAGVKVNIWQATKARKSNHKLEVHLTVYRMDSVLLASREMLPFLVAKKARAELLVRFIEKRKEYTRVPIKDDISGRIIGMSKIGYNDCELDIYNDLKELNRVGTNSGADGTSETIR